MHTTELPSAIPSLSQHTNAPWRDLLITDPWSSAMGPPRSGQAALLTFACLTPNYDVLKHKEVLMVLHVLNICAAPWSKGHLQQDPKYAHRKQWWVKKVRGQGKRVKWTCG